MRYAALHTPLSAVLNLVCGGGDGGGGAAARAAAEARPNRRARGGVV
eukprot:SAG31_NODE_38579_length_295_cov_0.785714_2_plen_46_part_01